MKYIIDKNCGPVYLQIYRQIRKENIDGVYLPGSKLPSMRLLCDELSVSTITVDHAYALLCEEGYVPPNCIFENLSFVFKIRNWRSTDSATDF